jgi:uncharacterized integral membrane protein (TIGR00698 family)
MPLHALSPGRSWWRFGPGPGLALAGVLAIAATTVARVHGGPQPLYALFFGMAFHHLSREVRSRPGIDFCARDVLRLGAGLLGARISATQIAALGWGTALLVAGGVVSSLLLALWLGRLLGLGSARATLAGGAVAICGASAALALSAVLPPERKGDRYTLTVVMSITVLSTLSMIVYPLLARALQLSPVQAGIFLGGSIHDVAQVVGAGFTLGPETGELATMVKLFRVALLVWVVLAVSLAFRSARAAAAAAGTHGPAPARQPMVPWFLWLFMALVLLNSLGLVGKPLQDRLAEVSRGCLLMAMAALGVKTSLRDMARAGWQPLALIVTTSLWLAGLMLAGAWWLHGRP